MKQTIQHNKFVELTYRVVDQQTGATLITVEFPIGYVHGSNQVLDSRVMTELEGKGPGDTISVPIDCTDLYGTRDESLVVTDRIENVPEEYREIGTRIMMENDKGEAKSFLVTRMDEETLTIDGNHPLCEREVIFELEVLSVRDATDEEVLAGGRLERGPDLGGLETKPI
ncbi:FKBP-type peptidyl-prolyl cis-trans isomerase [Thiorhodovibrio frisius]|uniref:peptidylprolyl isomerase n=1 Tax=Thiorhodovibrio frisius TaxID=631362 RepID=H8YXY1_9GAMM|nr:peptidyl-prolyl cis-trans isomerase [Thiorhodovibrio frisius]EIC23307.1 FKBP-type peptidyl-prolyl cis-trans isomerase [Thiorhodovibrio frisius]WPL23612.1 FKBP-type peptidyl-prolyl cis-trans isomerase SlyD [Thiorhodovibrio frisius]